MSSKSIAYLAIALWVVTVLGVGVLFVRGSTEPGSDGRRIVLLNEGERLLVLREMRGMLASVHGILVAYGANDRAGAAQAARASGMAAAVDIAPGLMAKLPLEFKELGFGTHRAFDALAQAVEDEGTGTPTLAKLGTLLGNCVACHVAYQLRTEDESQAPHPAH
jgi:hypothetical protein